MNFAVVPSDLQLLIVVFIALQGWAISQYARQHRFFVYWAWGWFWLAVLIALGRILPFIESAYLPIDTAAVRTGGTVAGLLQLYCFALGAWALGDRPLALSHKRLVLAAVLTAGALLGYAAGVIESPARSTAFAFVVRHLGLAFVFVYSARVLFAQRGTATGAALEVTSIGLLLYGLHLLYYATADVSTLIEMATGVAILPYDSLVVFGGTNWVIDMALSGILGIGVVMLLISEMRRARADIHQREAEFRGTFDHAPIGMALLVDSGEIVRANAALGDLLELPASTLTGNKLDRFMRGAEPSQQQGMAWLLSVTQDTSRRFQALLVSGSGREIRATLDISMLPGASDEHPRFIAQILDMTDQHNLQERLSHLAMHDNVTGLPNRAYLQEHLHAAAKRMQRRGTPMAVIFADLNKFKPVNDTHGHEAGDHVLQTVARRLKDTLRDGDFVSRFGGDEFVIVIEVSPGHDEVLVVAQRIADTIARPIPINGDTVRVSVSLGIVISRQTDEADDLMREADAAMYQAKRDAAEGLKLVDRSVGRA